MRTKFLLFIIIISIKAYSFQKEYADEILFQIKNINYTNSTHLIEKQLAIKKDEVIIEIKKYNYFISNLGVQTKPISLLEYKPSTSKDPLVQSINALNQGIYYYYYLKEKDSKAILKFEEALRLSKKNNYQAIQNEAYKAILEYHARYFEIHDNIYKQILLDFKKNAQDQIDFLIAEYYELFFIRRNNRQKFQYESDIKRCEALLDTKISNFYKGNISKHLAIHYQYAGKFEKSLFYYQKANSYYGNSKYGRFIEKKIALKISLGILKNKMGKNIESNDLFNSLEINKYNGKLIDWNLAYLYFWKAKNFAQLKNHDSAYYYLDRSFFKNMEFNQEKHINNITQLNLKYRTAEKEKLNIILQNQVDKKQREQRLFWISSISLLIIGSGIGVLIHKNTKRKQRIAEQEKEIEIQKTEKLLKDQELAAIDAMILGQEKERQRLANDLHDNLGSTLATVKLHFQHLKSNWNNPKVKNIEELYTNTDHLLDEAYQKVRTIAHEKNSGVMANQGLLVAIKNLAKKVSNSNKIQVEVQDFGLEERLDNSLEISIFRMIQELITNCIKHAEANEIHISLTNHDSLLNIIIEDNGKGFDPKTIIDKDGMGLKTIEKRVEHLEGTFEIDSTPNQGTNIIINIPI